MRLLEQIAKLLLGVPVEKAGAEVVSVIEDVRANHRKDAYYARTKLKPPRDLKDRPDDGARLWELTERLLRSWRAVG